VRASAYRSAIKKLQSAGLPHCDRCDGSGRVCRFCQCSDIQGSKPKVPLTPSCHEMIECPDCKGAGMPKRDHLVPHADR